MSEHLNPSERKPSVNEQSLSQISHLFLTGLRERQMGGAPLPQRRPPSTQPQQVSEESAAKAPRLTAVLAHHLTPSAIQRVREYARHLAQTSGRVGLVEIGDDGLRLSCFDAAPSAVSDATTSVGAEPVNAKRIRQALEEMSWDVDQWLLFLPGGPSSARARQLLAAAAHWTLLAAASDTGIVAAYRALKAVAPLGNAAISLAVLDAEDDAHGEIVHRKLSGASRQFLDRPVEGQSRVTLAQGVSDCVVLWCRASCGSADHWEAVEELAAKSGAPQTAEVQAAEVQTPPPTPTQTIREESPAQKPMTIAPQEESSMEDEVLDLSAGSDARAVMVAIVKKQSEWICSPITSPMCDTAAVAVDRQGRLTMLAAAAAGLADLPLLSRAFAWLNENRLLVKMALPQMNIDAAALPRLNLFVDHVDAGADQLAAIFKSGDVRVHTYRRVKWGEKRGLLLQAA